MGELREPHQRYRDMEIPQRRRPTLLGEYHQVAAAAAAVAEREGYVNELVAHSLMRVL